MVCIKGEKDVQLTGKTGMEQFIDIEDEIPGGIGGVGRWNIPLAVGNLVFQILVIPIVGIGMVVFMLGCFFVCSTSLPMAIRIFRWAAFFEVVAVISLRFLKVVIRYSATPYKTPLSLPETSVPLTRTPVK